MDGLGQQPEQFEPIVPTPRDKTDKPKKAPAAEPLMSLAAEDRAENKQEQKDASQEKRTQLKTELLPAPQFSPEDQARFETAFGKKFNKEELKSLSLDEMKQAETKDPGITKWLLAKETTKGSPVFHSLGSQELEMGIGLRDLVDKNASEITLKIHPKNLETGGNKKLLEKYPEAKDALAAYKKDGTVNYFERKSSARDIAGNFSNDDGYLRIFSGDSWHIDKVLTTEELEQKHVEIKNNKKEKDEDAQKKKSDSSQEEKSNTRVAVQETGEVSETAKKVVDAIQVKLRPDQRQMAELIAQRFAEKGLPKNLIAAALVNAYKESHLNPGIKNKQGSSAAGLFQIIGHGMNFEDKIDPEKNIAKILDSEVMKHYGEKLRERANEGAQVSELAGLFCRYIERPGLTEAEKQHHQDARTAFAKVMFPEDIV